MHTPPRSLTRATLADTQRTTRRCTPARRPDLPARIDGGTWPTSHVQGVTVDEQHGFVYWSFTQMLVKTDLDGKVIGTVEGLTGHLGDLDLKDFPNYSFFTVDGTRKPVDGGITGQPEPETGKLLQLRNAGLRDEKTGIRGWEFHGDVGFDALGDGRYYVAQASTVEEDGMSRQHGGVPLHRRTGRTPTPFEPVG